jgi:hypothetical protein
MNIVTGIGFFLTGIALLQLGRWLRDLTEYVHELEARLTSESQK